MAVPTSPYRPAAVPEWMKDPIEEYDPMTDPYIQAVMAERATKKRKEREALNAAQAAPPLPAGLTGKAALAYAEPVVPKPKSNPFAVVPTSPPAAPAVSEVPRILMSFDLLPGVHELLYHAISTSIADRLPENAPIVGTGIWIDSKNNEHFVLVSDLIYTDNSGHEKTVVFKMYDKTNGDNWKKNNTAGKFTVRQR